MIDRIRTLTGTLEGVYSRKLNFAGDFLDLAARFAPLPGTVVLLSGSNLDCARYHILGALPYLRLTARRRGATLAGSGRKFTVTHPPLDVLGQVLAACDVGQCIPPAAASDWPLQAGLLGYLAYDLKDNLEKLPRTSIDNLQLPHICLYAPAVIIIHDIRQARTRLFITERRVDGLPTLPSDRQRVDDLLAAAAPPVEPFCGQAQGFRSNFSRPAYEAAVEKVRAYIAAGDVYQVNICQRFEMQFSGSVFDLFRSLFKRNPAPFFAFINAGDHQVVSTSPERFLRQQGQRVETRPIKGTRPRGKTPAADRRLAEELLESIKDDAELSMIVDLMRNDIGQVCRQGSIRVTYHKKLEAYENVYHLVSIVEGRLDERRSSADLIAATFPGGSITGCPKIRAMEIIDELEPHRRHVYTGAIGYISFHGTMDLSIAIRTATVVDGRIVFSVGGGIVFDSDPAAEYEETLHKGQTLINVFNGRATPATTPATVWLNGFLVPAAQAVVPADDLGLLYGFGFFETIRADKGRPRYLNRHLARFHSTWRRLFDDEIPDLSWAVIIARVLTANGLHDQTAAVKILATAGPARRQHRQHTLIVSARPYHHRLAGKSEAGLHLAGYPHARQTPLAEHKTLNYLYYHLAAEWAARQGADEALITNPDGSLSETNSASLLLLGAQTAVLPESPHALPGTMQKVVCKQLRRMGWNICRKRLMPADLFSADDVLLTNSLMGVVPVLSVDGRRLKAPSNRWREINRMLKISGF